jgi:hypothetical protein
VKNKKRGENRRVLFDITNGPEWQLTKSVSFGVFFEPMFPEATKKAGFPERRHRL